MMQEKDFLWLASYMKDTYGIDLHKKKEIVEGRLEPYLHRNGYVNYQVWMEELKKKTSGRLEKGVSLGPWCKHSGKFFI